MDVKKEEHYKAVETNDDRYLYGNVHPVLYNSRSNMGLYEELQMNNYCTTKGLIWPFLFCVFVICVLPVLLVDNKKYCKQSIVPCYPWTDLGENK